jgi:hypothetical protein
LVLLNAEPRAIISSCSQGISAVPSKSNGAMAGNGGRSAWNFRSNDYVGISFIFLVVGVIVIFNLNHKSNFRLVQALHDEKSWKDKPMALNLPAMQGVWWCVPVLSAWGKVWHFWPAEYNDSLTSNFVCLLPWQMNHNY